MVSLPMPQQIENAMDMTCLRQLMEEQGDPQLLRAATYYFTPEPYKIKTASSFDSWLLRHGSDEIEKDYRTRMGPDGNVPLRALWEARFKKFRQKHHSDIALLYAVVHFNDKKRFEFSLGPPREGTVPLPRPGLPPLCPEGNEHNRPILIRAVQGHSGRIVDPRAASQGLFTTDSLPTPIIHATNADIGSILTGGLIPSRPQGSRDMAHFATEFPSATPLRVLQQDQAGPEGDTAAPVARRITEALARLRKNCRYYIYLDLYKWLQSGRSAFMSVNKVVLINETIPPAFFSRIVDTQRGEEISDQRIGEPLPRPGPATGPSTKTAQQPRPGDSRPRLPRTKKAPPPLPKKAPPPRPREHQQEAGITAPTTTRVPTKPGSSRDVPPPPTQEESRSRGQVEPHVQPGDQIINPAVPWADVQPTPALPQEPEQKTARWNLSDTLGTPVEDPIIPPTTMEDLRKYLDSDVFDPDPSNQTFQAPDHMLVTPGTGSQPAPPKVKQPGS